MMWWETCLQLRSSVGSDLVERDGMRLRYAHLNETASSALQHLQRSVEESVLQVDVVDEWESVPGYEPLVLLRYAATRLRITMIVSFVWDRAKATRDGAQKRAGGGYRGMVGNP